MEEVFRGKIREWKELANLNTIVRYEVDKIGHRIYVFTGAPEGGKSL